MNDGIDLVQLRSRGWLRIERAVPAELCTRLVTVLQSEFGLAASDPHSWPAASGGLHDLVPLWGHQAQWDIRQYPRFHRIWATLWGTDALWVSLDSCRFTPPRRPGDAAPYPLHWDHNPWDDEREMLQGVLALTDTAVEQGGFRCVPSLYRDRMARPAAPLIDDDGDENWFCDAAGREIVPVAAQAGDLIVWDWRLPHGNSANLSTQPRLAFYVSMFPAGGGEWLSQAPIESWRSGRCVPCWRDRPGYDRIEPWPPARLTPLGRRLLGLDPW